jgi:hypothetical protein
LENVKRRVRAERALKGQEPDQYYQRDPSKKTRRTVLGLGTSTGGRDEKGA